MTTKESMVQLNQIAALLGCSAATFFDPEELNQVREFAKLLQLWEALETKEQKKLAFDCIEAIACGFGAKGIAHMS